ncbi:hypothetical protein U27_06374 [Candidatus Vecturithrix granuli]|uniref:Uncharacterized protein n=1 Tax=Vecturithrix granuli TaxID=1499967 RepID=A0A081C485_VECG1|nr:hypothetical protein U27_06374 [Candidatus Vecturithrix granuli]
MNPHNSSNQLTVHIGAICGPTFAIIDMNQLCRDEICYYEILQGLPEHILRVNQIIMLFAPEYLKNHTPICSDISCNFEKIDVNSLPDDHIILRFWFSDITGQGDNWKEASVSIGGVMVAAKYMQQAYPQSDFCWRFASWSHDWCQAEGSWETFEAMAEPDGFFRVLCHREDFQAPLCVYEQAQDVLQGYFLEEERERILRKLHLLFSEKPLEQDYQIDIACIPEQSGSKMHYESKFLIIPYIPVFVGELHYAVPIGDFASDYFMEAVETVSDECLQAYRLSELFDYPDTSLDLLTNLGVLRDQWEETAYFGGEPFITKYPGGWTFVEDRCQADSAQVNFMTIEPEYPSSPLCSNSGSGALAAAIVQDLLHPGEGSKRYCLKGWVQRMEQTWIERSFKHDTINIIKRGDGKWEAVAPVRMLGQYVCSHEVLQFIRDGRG